MDHHHQTISMLLGRGDDLLDIDVVVTYTYRAGARATREVPEDAHEVEIIALFAGKIDLLPLVVDDVLDGIIDTVIENHEED